MLAQGADASFSANFTAVDWLVLIGYLVLVSVLGVKLAGKQTNINDFFRGGNKLPWYAVSASMIATIISAVTFVGVPAVAYAETGNFSYLQFGIVAGLLSRLFVAFVLVPAYYKYEVYSPYDYMSRQLGGTARSVTTILFSLLGILGQAARVYLTAIVLQLLLEDQLTALSQLTGLDSLTLAISVVGMVAVVWTMLGGIATVIWTDALLFLIFVVGGLVSIGVVAYQFPGGLGAVIDTGWAAGKFKLWTLTSTADAGEYASRWGSMLCEPYTLWAAVIAVTFGNIGSYGTDQLLAQRIFTCRSQSDAKLAVLSSWVAELVVALMLLVGVGLWAFYQQFPDQMTPAAAAAVAKNKDNIFPVFILTQVPVAMRGLIVAGIFAAAISSLTSILAALSQTTLSALYMPLRGLDPDQPIPAERNSELLRASRCFIVIWAVVLCATAVSIDWYVTAQKSAGKEVMFLDLALGLASYVIGTLLAAFLLAWLPIGKDAYGLIWSAPLSVFCVLSCRFHDDWIFQVLIGVTSVLLVAWIVAALLNSRRKGVLLAKTVWLVIGCAIPFLIAQYLWFAKLDPATGKLLYVAGQIDKTSIAWPWYAPVGGMVALVFGYLLGEPRSTEESPCETS